MVNAVMLEAQGRIDPVLDVAVARKAWATVRESFGMKPDGSARLITDPSAQSKVGLNARPTWSLSLNAGSAAGWCVNDRTCAATCVVEHGGNARYDSVRVARQARGAFLLQHPDAFATLLARDVEWASARGWVFGRPNTNSDVAWERVFPWLFEMTAGYDYTKRLDRVGWVAPNYRVTYSATAATREVTVRRVVERGDTVTMVFPIGKKADMVREWRGIPVIDGDVSDFRFGDPDGVIVGLRAKGGLRGLASHPLLSSVA